MGFLGRRDAPTVVAQWNRRGVTQRSDDIDLWSACKTGNIAFVKSIIEESPELLHVQLQGRTPLYYACLSGHIEIVKLLLQSGCTDDEFKSCHRAALTPEIRKLLKQYKFVENVLMGNDLPMTPEVATQPATYTHFRNDCEELPDPFPVVTAAQNSLADDSQSLATVPVNNTTASSSLKAVPFLEIMSPAIADETVNGLVDSDVLEEMCGYSSQEQGPSVQSPARTIQISMSGAVEVQETIDRLDLADHNKRMPRFRWKHPFRHDLCTTRRIIHALQTHPKKKLRDTPRSQEKDEANESPRSHHSVEDEVMEASSNGDDMEVVLQWDSNADLHVSDGIEKKKSPWTFLRRTILPTRNISTQQPSPNTSTNDSSKISALVSSLNEHLVGDEVECLPDVVGQPEAVLPSEDPIDENVLVECLESLVEKEASSETPITSLQPMRRSNQSSSTTFSNSSFATNTSATTNGDTNRILIPIACIPVTEDETEAINATERENDRSEPIEFVGSTIAVVPVIGEVKASDSSSPPRTGVGWNRYFFGASRGAKMLASGGTDSEIETLSATFEADIHMKRGDAAQLKVSGKDNVDIQSASSVSRTTSIVSAIGEASYLGPEPPVCRLQCTESEKTEIPVGFVHMTLEACGCIEEEMMVDEYSLNTMSFEAPLLPKVLRGQSTATNISTLSLESRQFNNARTTLEEVEPIQEERDVLVESSQSLSSSEHSYNVPNEVSIRPESNPEIDSETNYVTRVRSDGSGAEEDAPSLVSESSASFYKGDDSYCSHTLTTAEYTNDMVSRTVSERSFEMRDTWCGPMCY
jgi:Ankyrin repeats (3 copies)